MTLYSYDHCPYCVKARMIFGIKNIPFELITLANDDEAGPIQMIGQKMLPILKLGKNQYMPESLDIISKMDQLSDYGAPIVKESKNNNELSLWLSEARSYQYNLAMPRWIQMDLEEFKTSSAILYFKNKKERMIGSFATNMSESSQYVKMANEHLPNLESIISDGEYFWGNDLSLDDFHIFAVLRCLTTTKGVLFPAKINKYMERLSQKAKVPLYWNKAI